jgi:hypothetical protein
MVHPDMATPEHRSRRGIDRLAQDLQTEFPGVEGVTPRNLRYMRSLAEALA